MRRMVLALILVVAIPATASANYIGIFTDVGGTDCELFDFAGQVVTVYVIHKDSQGALGSRFKIENGPGFLGVFLAENPGELVIAYVGIVQDGVTACYASCIGSPIVVTSLLYFLQGVSTTCSEIRVNAHPASAGSPEVLTCNNDVIPVGGAPLRVNPDPTCPCYAFSAGAPNEERVVASGASFCGTVPTGDRTWGAVKALFE